MRFTIQIDCDNAAFEGENLGPELARILRHEASALEDAAIPDPAQNPVFDINGNRVGFAILTD